MKTTLKLAATVRAIISNTEVKELTKLEDLVLNKMPVISKEVIKNAKGVKKCNKEVINGYYVNSEWNSRNGGHVKLLNTICERLGIEVPKFVESDVKPQMSEEAKAIKVAIEVNQGLGIDTKELEEKFAELTKKKDSNKTEIAKLEKAIETLKGLGMDTTVQEAKLAELKA